MKQMGQGLRKQLEKLKDKEENARKAGAVIGKRKNVQVTFFLRFQHHTTPAL